MMIRDPRDVVASYKHYTVEKGYKYLDAAFSSLNALDFAEKNKTKIIVIKYEDLVRNPLLISKKIFSSIGLDFDKKTFSFFDFSDRLGKKWGNNSSFNDFSHGISTKPIGRYKQILSNAEINFVQNICGDIMQKNGYSLYEIASKKEINDKLGLFLKEKLLKNRWDKWKKTGEGVESYPSDPPLYKSSRQLYPDGK